MEAVTDERTYEGLPAVPAVVMAVLEATGIRAMIDAECARKDRVEHVLSPGMAVKLLIGAMIGRGKRPLYRMAAYYATAPVDVLFGPDTDHGSLSDTAIASRLDVLACTDLRDLLLKAYRLLQEKYGFATGCMFMDASNYTMYGVKYADRQAEYERRLEEAGFELEPAPMPAYGGNQKDGRKDLVQLNISHVVDGNGIPVCSRSYDGNTSDIEMNRDMLEYLRRMFDMRGTILMADCKLCVAEMVTALVDADIAFVTKVPANFNGKLREAVVESVLTGTMDASTGRPGRLYYETEDVVDGRRCRVVAYVLPRARRDSEAYIRGRGFERAGKKLKALKGRRFYCEKDAADAFRQAMSETDADCYAADLRIVDDPAAEARKGDGKRFRAVGENLRIVEERVERAVIAHCLQVLITDLPFANGPSDDRRRAATADDVIDLYLEQYKAEAGFKMMKSGMGIADVYIHTPSRIGAIAFVSSLSTMVCKTLDRVQAERKAKDEPRMTVGAFTDIHERTFVKYDRTHDRLSVVGRPGATSEVCGYMRTVGLEPVSLLSH